MLTKLRRIKLNIQNYTVFENDDRPQDVKLYWYGGSMFEIVDEDGNIVDEFNICLAEDITPAQAREYAIDHFQEVEKCQL